VDRVRQNGPRPLPSASPPHHTLVFVDLKVPPAGKRSSRTSSPQRQCTDPNTGHDLNAIPMSPQTEARFDEVGDVIGELDPPFVKAGSS